MRSQKSFYISSVFAAFIMAVFATASIGQTITSPENSTHNEPTVVSTSPSDGEEDVARNMVIEITFSEEMDSTTFKNHTFSLMQGNEAVEGNLEHSGEKAMFRTQKSLKANSEYTAKLTSNSNYSDENSNQDFNDEESDYRTSQENGKEWSFTTGGNSSPVGAVDLGSSAEYVILTNSSIHNDSSSNITGEKGYNPDMKDSKDRANDTAYWLNNEDVDKEAVRRDTARKMNDDSDYSGNERDSYGDDNNNLDAAFDDMKMAYDDASERTPADFIDFKFTRSDDHADSTWNDNDRSDKDNDMDSRDMSTDTTDTTDQNSLDIRDDNPRYGEGFRSETDMDDNGYDTSVTLEPGIYKWNDSVEISTNITLSGSADDVWIFQVADGLTLNSDVKIALTDGAVAEHIFWQVAGEVTIGSGAHFEGIILSENGITMENGATLNGRLLSQSDVSLDENTITEPHGSAEGQRTSRNR